VDDRLDQKAVTELTVYWTRAQPQVAGFISLMVPDFHDAEDVLQRVAVALVKKFHEFDRQRSFLDWAVGIARYEILAYRRRKARDRHVFDENIIEQISQMYREAEPAFDAVREALGECVGKVTGRNRRLLEMWYLHGVNQVQIARELDTTPNTVYVSLHRIRTALRDCVRRRLKLAWEAP
jgi:RNA polymerase sigma-70 factor (ECF subfamily)